MARHPSVYKIPCFNYVSALLKISKGTAKIINYETFKDSDRSITV